MTLRRLADCSVAADWMDPQADCEYNNTFNINGTEPKQETIKACRAAPREGGGGRGRGGAVEGPLRLRRGPPLAAAGCREPPRNLLQKSDQRTAIAMKDSAVPAQDTLGFWIHDHS